MKNNKYFPIWIALLSSFIVMVFNLLNVLVDTETLYIDNIGWIFAIAGVFWVAKIGRQEKKNKATFLYLLKKTFLFCVCFSLLVLSYDVLMNIVLNIDTLSKSSFGVTISHIDKTQSALEAEESKDDFVIKIVSILFSFLIKFCLLSIISVVLCLFLKHENQDNS
jgi:hypothetical protein